MDMHVCTALVHDASPRRTQPPILVFECFTPITGVLVDNTKRHNW